MDFEIDVIFEVQGGILFSVEVNRFETIRDVKEKIQSIHQIPISQQNFLFNGQFLEDHLYIYTTPILHGSHVHLVVATADAAYIAQPRMPIHGQFLPAQPVPELQPSTLLSHEYDPFVMPEISSSTQLMQQRPSPPPPLTCIPNPQPVTTVTVNVKMPKSRDRVRIESDRKDTVRKLKEKIAAQEDMQGVPLDRIVLQLHSMRQELKDQATLEDCAIVENPEIDVFLKPALRGTGSNKGGSSKGGSGRGGSSRAQSGKVKVKVVPMETKERIEIEMFPLDMVSLLRQKLDELHRTLGFRLPEDGRYFFIHRQQVMDEDQSFYWHGVRDGDIIETFDGFVTSGPGHR
ncbi:unnamed protein product [Sphenostylis stenocarpa]|uniref:Ubiquitin-like domain-containing protein n=1 Tax=Sphenostylis stenocarpa TaxID=92480 RepID=A0AA86W2F8_9FABA|nr:unnamed protein product [Sphenostylis stenocarpa]